MPEMPKTCRTCVYMNTCPIYKVARETQIQNIQPEMFGSMWHMTEEEHRAEQEQKEDERVVAS